MDRMSSKDLEATRSIAVFLESLETMKRTGFDEEDGWKLWCMDWLRTSSDPDTSLEMKVHVAKSSLSRMKSIAKVLESVSASLESSIDHVANESRDMIRVSGFSSLPDDVIARIFELYHEEYRNLVGEGDAKNWGKSFRAPNVLTQVCKRFRQVALHIPALWDCVSGRTRHAREMIPILMDRCQYPTVFLDYDFFQEPNTSNSADFLRILPPASQWRGLAIFHGRTEGSREFFEDIHAFSNGRLDNLLDLRIAHVGETPDEDEDDGEDGDESTNIYENDAAFLAEWRLPKLKRLTLSNIIPTRMDCPNLQECRIDLGTNKVHWDIHTLKKFFLCIPLLESLSFSFCNDIPDEGDIHNHMQMHLFEPVRLSRLRSLELNVTKETEGSFLRNVLDILDLSTISRLRVSLLYARNNTKDLASCLAGWLFGISFTNTNSHRVFPNVKDFHLALHKEYKECALPYGNLMRCLPQVRNLELNLPEISEPSFILVFKYLKELRSIRLDDRNSSHRYYLADDFERVDQQKLDQLERFEIEGGGSLWGQKDRLERRLESKLIWRT
ncbi:hypothetical protein SCHPADRAFT_656654 [Schizopora paradoxa]|uniref:Uncharacterized protein n=1 Tax=Schizopora paradoxa TaxID=27342 RepID=A0A0H2R5X7_9AGAM|nr:hypothetical protein SCHPADRAFT_656654 [Schizopora paradoxa]